LQRLVRPETLFPSSGGHHRAKGLVFHSSRHASPIGTNDFTHCPTRRLALPEPKPTLPNAQVQLPVPENPRPFHRDTGRRSTATTCSARNLVRSTGDHHRAKCFVFRPSQPASPGGDRVLNPPDAVAPPPNAQVQLPAPGNLTPSRND
ncbi:hypothetical protein, partial [Zavarzinella formosa]|uniref:hypothetical protein n=1 Tax=Zavarzinella formosa TaxID=360055 RepID=UPI001EE6464E